MKNLSKALMLLFALALPFMSQASDRTPKIMEQVMEISSIEQLLSAIAQLEEAEATQENKTKLGILYHDAALKVEKGQREYIEKSYTQFTVLMKDKSLSDELRAYVAAYQASSLALLGANRENKKMIEQAFVLFEQAEKHYNALEFVVPYLRSKTISLLPYGNIYKNQAKRDLEVLIDRYGLDKDFANDRIMAHAYYSWAAAHQRKRFRKQAMRYLEKAIELNPEAATAQRSKQLLYNWKQPYEQMND